MKVADPKPTNERQRPTLSPSEDEGMFPSGTMSLWPNWKAPQRRPQIEQAAAEFRRIVLPRLLARPGLFQGAAWSKTHLRTVSYGTYRPDLELAMEATLERIIESGIPNSSRQGILAQRENIVVRYAPEPALRLLVMLDTSLSMHGPCGAMAALIAAVMSKQMPSGALALLVFHAEPKLVIRFGDRVKPLEAAYRALRASQGGVTNISAALEHGLRAMAATNNRSAHAVLITDGERTAGPDPSGPAKRFKSLHVVLVGQRNKTTTREIARLGKGLWRQVARPENVPSVLLRLMQRLRRG